MKRFKVIFTILSAILILAVPQLCKAVAGHKKEAGKEEEKIIKLKEIQVTAPKSEGDIVVTPSVTKINIEEYKIPGTPQNITDILKDRAIIDFRGESDLTPSNDTIQMRGFGGRRFITAIDDLTIEKSGFGYSNHAVDYALLSLGQIERIEIIPGPHSALHPGQSIGGVLNIITKKPKRYPTLKPDFKVKNSYRSYNTQNHSLDMDGGADSFIYGLGFHNYHTNGFLRHNETDINTFYSRLGWLLPSDGYISLSGTYTNQDRELTVNNDPNGSNYNHDDPDVTVAGYDPWQDPELDKEAYHWRLNYKQPSSIGLWSLGAYYNKENVDQFNWEGDPNQAYRGFHSRDVVWGQVGGKIQDEIEFSKNHLSTVGFDMVVAHSERLNVSRHKRLDRRAGYFQHKWLIIPRLTLVGGLRYEDVNTWIHNRITDRNTGEITGYYNNAKKQDYIDRHFSEFVPKSFLTYALDDVSEMLKETSLSLGLSKIWHAPTSGMDMHGNGLPGFYVEPEHGMAYDLILTKRFQKDIDLKVSYAFYEIKDYIAYNNRKYAEYIPSKTNPVPPGLEYKDARINLEKVHRHGVEFDLNGYILDDLSFYLSYAFQEFKNKGSELVAKEELDDRAKHRVNAGLGYKLFDKTLLMLDYKHQSKQVAYNSEEVAPDEWDFYTVPMDAYHVFDLAIEQNIFKEYGFLKKGVLKLYVNNLFNEEYQNSNGYPMTDRNFGGEISFKF